MSENTPDAVDIFDWEYLRQIAELVERPRTWTDGAKRFAYWFTSTGDVAAQNKMLEDLLRNATYKQSPETCEEVITALCKSLQADRNKMREFARNLGIKLSRL